MSKPVRRDTLTTGPQLLMQQGIPRQHYAWAGLPTPPLADAHPIVERAMKNMKHLEDKLL